MTPSGSNKKVANSLVAVSCAAVLAVYSAGYARTRSAASQFEVQAERRAATPGQQRPAAPSLEVRPVEAAAPTTEPARVALTPPRPTKDAPAEPNLIASAEPLPPAAVAAPPVETAVAAAAPSLPATVAPPAPLPPPEPVAPPAPPAPKWKDGSYTGWGTSRHGDIEATVVIEGGRIQSAIISQCLTRYSCSVIDMLPPQVTQRQSPDVDVVSRATQSADAFYYAVVEALGKAK